MIVRIESSWRKVLENEFEKQYFQELTDFVTYEYSNGVVYPEINNIFKAFELTSFDEVKVVILGQDPYHGSGQAVGLSFGVSDGIPIPPSLRNIYKEIKSDIDADIDIKHGDLSHWAKQGVLLLNSTLTVKANSPGSHQNHGWEKFTDAAIQALSDQKQNIVFILWGNYARKKVELIDSSKHLIIESTHPSPFSARNGFFGSRPFSKANKYLKKNGLEEIKWC